MNTLTQTIAISKETVAEMPVVAYDGGITVVDTPELARVALRELTRARVVGFDTETRPSFQRGRSHNVALMQLSTEDHCFLFRINILGISEHLRHFLEDPEIIKIGLSVHDDFSVMRRLVDDIDPQGFIDLQEYVKYFHINDISLQKIYAIIFGEKISKNQRLTNWEAETLTPQQQTYAAIDAWACLRLYRTLRSGLFHPDESPYVVDRSMLDPTKNNQLVSPPADLAKTAAPSEEKPAKKAAAKKKPAAKTAQKTKAKTSDKPKTKSAPKADKEKKPTEAKAKTKTTRKPRVTKKNDKHDNQ